MNRTTRTPVPLQVHALASGSSGNATLVRYAHTNLLIDAGLGVRALANALAKRGILTSDLNGILLTHEHADHSCGAGNMARRTNAPIIANNATLEALRQRDAQPFQMCELPTGGTMAMGSIGIRSFAVSHDAAEPVGYVLEADNRRIVYLTDTGCVTAQMRAALADADLAVVEANYDTDWLWRGPYPQHRKERVASDHGHLSNLDCADMLAERLDTGGRMNIWLAHLSRVNNSPALARRSVQQRIISQTRAPFTLDVALRDQPSLTWVAGRQSVQLALI